MFFHSLMQTRYQSGFCAPKWNGGRKRLQLLSGFTIDIVHDSDHATLSG